MYLEHFQLAEEPFSVTSNPRFLFLSKSHEEALAHLDYCIKFRKGFAAITGEIGTGKTTLLNTLITHLDQNFSVAFVYRSASSTEELMQYVFKDLGLPTELADRSSYLNCFNDYLLAEARAGRDVVLVIDEGQNLPVAVLEDLRLISNFETPDKKLVQIILAGQTELGDKLRQPELRQLNQRISIQYQVKPLNADETGSYIQHRLKTAKARQLDIFRPAAVKLIHQLSGGIPRVINQICDTALVRAAFLHKSVVDPGLVRAVVREDFQFRSMEGATGRRPLFNSVGGRRAALAGAGLALVCVAGLGGWWLGHRGEESMPAVVQAADATEPTAATPAGVLDPAVAERASTLQEEPAATAHEVTPAAAERQAVPRTPAVEAPPPAGETERVRVRLGDSFSRLALEHYGFSTWELMGLMQRHNPHIQNPNKILAGDWIELPALSDTLRSRLKTGQPF